MGSGGPSTSAVSASRTERRSGFAHAPWRRPPEHYTMAWPNEEPEAGRSISYLAALRSPGCRGRPVSAKSWGGSAPTGLPAEGVDGAVTSTRSGRQNCPRQSGGNIALFAKAARHDRPDILRPGSWWSEGGMAVRALLVDLC